MNYDGQLEPQIAYCEHGIAEGFDCEPCRLEDSRLFDIDLLTDLMCGWIDAGREHIRDDAERIVDLQRAGKYEEAMRFFEEIKLNHLHDFQTTGSEIGEEENGKVHESEVGTIVHENSALRENREREDFNLTVMGRRFGGA